MPITLNGDTGITTPSYGGADAAEYLVPVTAFKNRIINGAMVIDQRNAGASVTINNITSGYTLDRWGAYVFGTGVFSVQRSSVAPVGFTNSCLLTVTTADASIASDDYYLLSQFIEGFNFADMNFGTANAQTVTISFWVRSSLTGTFGCCLRNGNANYSYPFQYVINQANTWEQKSVSITGAPAGTWLTTNGIGAALWFSIGSGTDYTDTANVWTTKQFVVSANSSTNLISTNGATWAVTGVQLEVGSTATSFDYRPYGTELALCQRYYQQFNADTVFATMIPSAIAGSTSNGNGPRPLLVSMRATPTLTNSAASTFAWSDGVNNPVVTSVSYAGSQSTTFVGHVNFSASGTLTQFRPYYISANNTTSAFLGFSAEL